MMTSMVSALRGQVALAERHGMTGGLAYRRLVVLLAQWERRSGEIAKNDAARCAS